MTFARLHTSRDERRTTLAPGRPTRASPPSSPPVGLSHLWLGRHREPGPWDRSRSALRAPARRCELRRAGRDQYDAVANEHGGHAGPASGVFPLLSARCPDIRAATGGAVGDVRPPPRDLDRVPRRL